MVDKELSKQFFDMLQESQWWSPEQLKTYQRSQLAQLLRHARSNVPFYAGRLDAVFKRNGDIDWDRWAEIPIVKRQDVVDHGDDMLAQVLPKGHEALTVATTSGTSGVAITLTSTQIAHVALNGNRFRYYRWHNIDWTEIVCSMVPGEPSVAPWPDGEMGGAWGPAWDPDSIDGMMLRINRATSVENTLEFLERKRPAYLTTGVNRAYALAITAKRVGVNLRLRAFLPHGTSVGDRARDAIFSAFGAPSIDLYSSKEAGHIAHLCPSGSGLHVNAESMLLEIVDEAGLPVGPGQQGRVVITPLFNAAQPLIRYDQGDFAAWGPACSCGRRLPVLTRLIGRSTTVFYHPDGRVASSFLGVHRHLLNCEMWQVAQTGPTSFEVRYVPLDPEVPGDEAALAARIRELYFPDAQVTFRRVDEIPVEDFGKPREYVNEWMPADG
jgi:phenylacetate-CoA ligase